MKKPTKEELKRETERELLLLRKNKEAIIQKHIDRGMSREWAEEAFEVFYEIWGKSYE